MGGRHKSPERKEAKEKQLTPSERYDNLVKKLSDGPKNYVDDEGINVKIGMSQGCIYIERKREPDIKTSSLLSINNERLERWRTYDYLWWYTDYNAPKQAGRIEGVHVGIHTLYEITEQDAKDALEKIEKRVEDAEKYEKEEKEREEEEKRQESRKFLYYVEQNQKEQDAKDIEAIEESFW